MKVYKIEIKLTKEQQAFYKLTVSACRFVYNLYVEFNKEAYKRGNKFISAYTFSKFLNNEYIPSKPDKAWIKEASSKALKQALIDAERSYKLFFKGVGGAPKYKKVITDKSGYYFTRTDKTNVIRHQRNKIKIPCMGWITLKEYGYLPVKSVIRSGVIKKRVNKYFISIITDDEPLVTNQNTREGIGIDLGIKELMVCSNGFIYPNFNKTIKIRKMERKVKRCQRELSRKYRDHQKDKTLTWNNYLKSRDKLNKQYYKLECVRNDYINKFIDHVIEQKPNFITLENLNISGMRKNKHLAKAISDSKLYYTKQVIIQKAKKHGIEVREVDRFYPSSKTCSCCGEVKKDLKLKDRIYKCSCGLEIDRDFNASINLKEAKEYKILTTGGLPESNACGMLNKTVVANSNAEHVEARRSQFVLKSLVDVKRGTHIKFYRVSILQKS